MEEDLDFQIAFFEELLRDDPDYVEALIPLGDAYTRQGLYEKGLEVDLRLSALCPRDPVVLYNLACSYSLLQRPEDALRNLERALELGYRDLSWLEKDGDLEGIRQLPAFRQLIRKYFPPS